jgi:hypothetical protein
MVLPVGDLIIRRARVISPPLLRHDGPGDRFEIMQVEDLAERRSPGDTLFACFFGFGVDFDCLFD